MSGYTTTPNYGLFKPTINADNDQWGNHLNANADTLDTTLKTIQNSAGVTTWNTRAGAVILTGSDVTTVLPPSSTTPSMDGTAAVGTATTWARADHVHPTDTGIAAAAAAAGHNIGRNLLHNPLFNVAQRGAGPFTASGVYTLDRWQLVLSLDATGVQSTAFGDAQRAAIGDEAAVQGMQVSVTGNAGASAFTCVNQYIEGVRRLAGKTVTVSFWAYAVSGAPRIGVAATQQFGTGGSPSADVLINGTATPALTSSPARYSITFTYPSAAGKTLGTNGNDYSRLALFFSCGATNNTFAGGIGVQSATFLLWGVQLEIGSVATPLEKPDPRYDLSNCQRFYQIGIFQHNAAWSGATAQNFGSTIQFATQMRAAPTVVPNFTTLQACTAGGAVVLGNSSVLLYATTSASGVSAFFINNTWTASADL